MELFHKQKILQNGRRYVLINEYFRHKSHIHGIFTTDRRDTVKSLKR